MTLRTLRLVKTDQTGQLITSQHSLRHSSPPAAQDPNKHPAPAGAVRPNRCQVAQAAGLGEGFTGHSGRVGMAQDLVKSGVELPALMTAGRWKSAKMPARYTERQAADRGAVTKYYQER